MSRLVLHEEKGRELRVGAIEVALDSPQAPTELYT